jgi:hypothetical protein
VRRILVVGAKKCHVIWRKQFSVTFLNNWPKHLLSFNMLKYMHAIACEEI